METLRLIEPTPDLEAEFREMAAEWREAGQDRFADAFGDFRAYVDALARQQDSQDLPPDWVPWSTFWLLSEEGRVVGTSRLRYWLVPHLEMEGGHIGYDVRPSARGQGYGRALLALTLEKARDLGLEEVLVTCDRDNVASVRVIEKNGGQKIGQTVPDGSDKVVTQYRIVLSDLAAGAQGAAQRREGRKGDS
jgi:predicted acetyltransferase